MFISKFNQLIRSRILWGFFAIIISVAFVSVGSCGRSSSDGPTVAGKLNGKKVSVVAYEQVAEAIRGFGRNRNTEIPVREVARRTWEQVAAMQIAAKNGLTVRQEDVRNEIWGLPMFQGPNGFDRDRYRAVLRNEGLHEAQYEELVSRGILMEKIGALVQSAAWISPMELDDEIAAMTDTFTVQTATLSNRFADVEMRLSEEDYKKFYEEKQESFRLPDRMSVRYIAIPASNYLARVTVSEDELLDHYDSHLDKYPSSDTNTVNGVKPFEDVKDEIRAELLLDEARMCAETNATFTLYGKLARAAADNALAVLAAEEQVEVMTSALFAQSDPLPWAGNAKEFASMAFSLEPESFETRFAVVAGKNEIFVMEYHQKSETHIPAFEDVLEDVKTRAQGKARVDAFDSYVKEMRTDISTLMKAGKTFEEAAKEKALNVSTSLTYTASEMQMKPFENSYAIAFGARTLKKGELSEAVAASMAQSLLIYVEDRQQGDALAAAMVSSKIRDGLERRRGNTLFSDWLKWNLDQQRFEPSSKFTGGETEDADEPPERDE